MKCHNIYILLALVTVTTTEDQEKTEPEQTLVVKGSTIDESQRFTINLHCKSADFTGNDVPLHISVRFDEGKVEDIPSHQVTVQILMNNCSKTEERRSNLIKKRKPSDIRMRAHDDRFQIVIDQKEFKDYEHRHPQTLITLLSTDGVRSRNDAHAGRHYQQLLENKEATESVVGSTLYINGTVKNNSTRFNIDLLRRNGDIALHFNPRFDEKAVIRNALAANEWGNEEKEGKTPFEKGVGFDLAIKNEAYAFQIFVNGERFTSFAHRADPNDITGLQIQGDIELTGIQIQ
ncbi:galactoside-binding lectin [Oesophagostomum dentatum]|uniref:Galectin n=1 Tax=Oesophagostomum dentatum TaxID=61180 RepID=A0A0B1TA97_OESDE|nr:galactoside-binding lectin [Oesophagostomum dentatum]